MFGNCHIAIGESLGKQASKSEWVALAVLAVRAVLAAFVDAVALCCRRTLLLADDGDEGSRGGSIGILLPRAELLIVVVPWVWLVY